MGNILVVDDEPYIRFFLERLLTRDGHEVTAAPDGTAALALLGQAFDVALLDINLGRGPSGIDVLEAIASQYPQTMVILLTGQATLETAVAALRRGAYDYLFKPCLADEIRQTVRQALAKKQEKQLELIGQLEQNMLATLREMRTGAGPTPTAAAEGAAVAPPKLVIDVERHVALYDDHPLHLTPIEFTILSHLAEQSPHIVTAQQLVNLIHSYHTDAVEASNIIRSHIYRLRQKLREVGTAETILHTVRGVGYAVHL